jgi:hypothetical protein
VTDAQLLPDGNCIPLAMWRHRDVLGDAAAPAWSADFVSSTAALSTGLRQYKTCFHEGKAEHDAHLGFAPLVAGAYLLHCEHRGRPHCVAVRVDETVQQAFVYHSSTSWKMPVATLTAMVDGAIDAQAIACFRVWSSRKRPPTLHAASDNPGNDHLLSLAGLEAGAALPSDSVNGSGAAVQTRCDSDVFAGADDASESSSCGDRTNEAATSVRLYLMRQLEREVTTYAASVVLSGVVDSTSGVSCELCPFYRVSSRAALVRHLDRDHAASVNYCASGRKMLSVAYALFDRDQIAGVPGDGYLARAARELRRTVVPALSSRLRQLDRHLVLVLTSEGPAYRSAEVVARSCGFRRVGNTYYDRTFADALLREAILSHGRVRTMLPRLIARLSTTPAALTELLPRSSTLWLCVMEDVMSTPFVVSPQGVY